MDLTLPLRRRRFALFVLGLWFAGLAAGPVAAAAPAVAASATTRALGAKQQAQQAAFDAFYGLYVNGQKVGWMHGSLQASPKIVLSYELQAKIGGMGQTSDVSMREQRFFSPQTGDLTRIEFEQRASTGAVVVTGQRRGKVLAVRIRAGGASRTQDVPVQESLTDNLALWRLAGGAAGSAAPVVGETDEAMHFDPATQQVSGAKLRIEAVQDQLIGGVATKTVRIASHYPALGVTETSVFDGHGQLLQTQMGSFFEARLEEESMAKTPGVVGDMLLDAVVHVPRPIEDVNAAKALHLQLRGLEDVDLPQSSRQQISRGGDDTWQLSLSLDAPIAPGLRLRKLAGAKSAAPREPQEVQQARAPSAFVQSDAPEIVAMARRACSVDASVAQCIERLHKAVRGHLRSEYVPSFSNALEAYHSGRGDCTEHSVLFVALARAVGIPARVAVGVAYWPPGDGFGWHAWAEVWLGDRWLSVDPTWGQSIADVTHLKIAGGDVAAQARVVMLLGRLQISDWSLGALPPRKAAPAP